MSTNLCVVKSKKGQDSFMVIKGKKLGGGKPCVCVPVMERTKEGIIDEILSLTKTNVDMIEWRVDLFEHYRDCNELRAVLQAVSPYIKEKIFLYTFRTKAQGGHGDATTDELEDIHDIAAESNCVDLLDLEYFEEEYPVYKIKELQEQKVKVVASHHDFHETPDSGVMKMLLERMCAGNADIVKLAVMPNTTEDVLRLLTVTNEFYKENPDTPIITMSMGKMGMISRVCGETFGSCVTFASKKEASAPGQMPYLDVIDILDKFHKYSIH